MGCGSRQTVPQTHNDRCVSQQGRHDATQRWLCLFTGSCLSVALFSSWHLFLGCSRGWWERMIVQFPPPSAQLSFTVAEKHLKNLHVFFCPQGGKFKIMTDCKNNCRNGIFESVQKSWIYVAWILPPPSEVGSERAQKSADSDEG